MNKEELPLSKEETGDNLDGETKGNYPRSDGSSIITISVDKLLQAALDKILKLIPQLPELLEQSKDDCKECKGFGKKEYRRTPNRPGIAKCLNCNGTGKGEPNPERIVVLGKGKIVVSEEYDPQAEEFGWFLERGWIPPEKAKGMVVLE